MRLRARWVVLLCASVWVASCSKGGADRTTQQLADLQKKKEADAKAKKEDKLEALPTDLLKLDPPYDERLSDKVSPDGPCPEGLWALFPGDAPGSTPEDKKTNAAKRKELADALKDKQFSLKLRAGAGVTLKPFDAPAGQFTVEVIGTIDCSDALGRVAIAWTATKPETSGPAGEISQYIWTAAPLTFSLPMKSQLEAKEFEQKNKVGIAARIIFRLGKTEVDKKLKKVAKVTEKAAGETLGYGGGMEDWGAGRLVHVELVGVRIASDRERNQLFDLRGQQ